MERPARSRAAPAPPPTRRRPRVLLVSCKYFLVREIDAALARLGIPRLAVPLEDDAGAFARSLAEAALAFGPTMVLTVNRYGLDDTGKVLEVLRRLRLPVACWLIDSHTILLGGITAPEEGICYCTCDKAALPDLAAKAGPPPLYLPLATDPEVFRPGPPAPGEPAWPSRVAFVGHSWAGSIAANHRAYAYPQALSAGIGPAAAAWEAASHTLLWPFLEKYFPALHTQAVALAPARRKWFAALVLWEAAKLRRVRQVSRLAPFKPLIVGDAHWDELLAGQDWYRRLPDLDYEADLPRFYPRTEVVFNSTSPQMAAAVNQRAFDVPACGGFVVSERRPELEELFDSGVEAACYDSEDAIEATVRQYLENPAKRRAVTLAARKRILAEHTYEHRLRRLLAHLRAIGL